MQEAEKSKKNRTGEEETPEFLLGRTWGQAFGEICLGDLS